MRSNHDWGALAFLGSAGGGLPACCRMDFNGRCFVAERREILVIHDIRWLI